MGETPVAYDALQKRLIALELARTEGRIKPARQRLQQKYFGLARIGATTISRLKKDPSFARLVDECRTAIDNAQAQAIRESEIARARADSVSN